MSPIVTNSVVIDSKQTGMKIGLLGGTFDPIHFGHIKPALEVLKQLSLDKVWLMPNHIPPHKQTTQVSSQHRLAMTQLVCQQYEQFEVCDIEINRDTPSYSATTLQLLAEQFPQHQFYFIMGTDSFIQLPSWYQWQSIFDLCNIVVCQRPGWQLDKNSQMAELLAKNAVIPTTAKKGKIFPVDVTLQDISSTEIRQFLNKVAINQSHNEPNNASGFESNTAQTSKSTFDSTVAAMLPNVIQQYIYQHHLYQNK